MTKSSPLFLSFVAGLSGLGQDITVTKTFEGKKPHTLCAVTDRGRAAFEDYVETLKSYIRF